jgi:DNA-binding transcriptional regulator YdaS (Cro superfamily)
MQSTGGSISCGIARKGRPKPPELQQALDAVGGVPALAELLKVSPQRVARWRTISAEYAVELEAKIGLPRERVRPDRTMMRRGR